MKRLLLIAWVLPAVLFSCSTAVKENIEQRNMSEMEKINIGNLLALYPKPMTVVGAEINGKVNWLVVGQLLEKDFVQLNVRHILRDKQHGGTEKSSATSVLYRKSSISGM